jgi:hypothetical protein
MANASPKGGWGDMVRLHPSLPYSFTMGTHDPALLMRNVSPAGEVVGLHAVFLDRNGRKAVFDEPERSAKKSFGHGGVVILRADGPRLLAGEGPEDMLTAAACSDAASVCTAGAGTLARAADYMPDGWGEVVLVADHDDAWRTTAAKAAALLIARGIAVRVAMPPDGIKDANALLKAQGLDAVRAMIGAAEPWLPPDSQAAAGLAQEAIRELLEDDSKPTQRDLVIEMGLSVDPWHDPDHVAYPTIDIGTHREHHAIRSPAFQRWLLAEFGRRHPRTIGDRTIPTAPAAQAKADVILNGIPSLAARPDLAGRSIVLTLPPIADSQRRTEAEFWAEFNQRAPCILGALLDAVSAGLRNLPTTRLSYRPRIADFAQWAVAAAPACGWRAQDFLDAYNGNRRRGEHGGS